MADVAAQPFINFGQQEAEIGQTNASAGLARAQTGLVGQQATTAEMNNQIQRESMPLIMRSMHEAYADQSDANAGNPDAGNRADRSGVDMSATGGWDGRHGGVEDTFRNQNFVEPVTQREAAMLKMGTAMSMSPNNAAAGTALVERMKTERQLRIEQQTARNQLRNGNIYDSATAVHNTDPDGDSPGVALQALEAIDKPDADQIRKLATGPDGKLDAAKADDMAREHAGHIAAVSHLYSGRKTKDVNGQLVDEATDQPVAGQRHLYTGSTGDQLAEDRKWAKEQVDVPTTSGGTIKMPRWKAPEEFGGFGGKVTAEQYALQQDQMRRKLPPEQRTDAGGPPVPPAQVLAQRPAPVSAAPGPPNPTATAPGARPAVAVGPAAVTAAKLKAATAQTPEPAAQYGTAAPVGTPEYGQRMNVALAAAKPAQYGPTSTQTKVGLPVAGQAEGIKLFQSQQKDLREYGSELSVSADQSLQNFNAARRLLAGDTTLPVTGIVGHALQKASATLGILDTNEARVRQEAAKYLVQGAVSGLKETYGARPGVFDVKINVEKAFPSLENMGINEVRDLINSQITQAQYLKDSAQRASQYAGGNYEPGDFKTWNARFFPRANIVTPPEPVEIAKAKDPQAAYNALKPGESYVHDGKTLYKGGKPK